MLPLLLTVIFLLNTVNAVDERQKYQPGPALIDETTRWSKCWDTNQTIYDFSVEEVSLMK